MISKSSLSAAFWFLLLPRIVMSSESASHKSEVIFPQEYSTSFDAVPFISGPVTQSFYNVSVIWLRMNDGESCAAYAERAIAVQLSTEWNKNPGLYFTGYHLCFQDDIARLLEGHYSFVLFLKRAGVLGWSPMSARRRKGAAVAHFQTHWIYTGEEIVRVNITPAENPFSATWLITSVAVSSFFLGVVNMYKLRYGARLLRNHLRVSKRVTPAVIIIAIENVASILVLIVAIDPVGIFGLYSERFWYPMINMIGVLTFTSTAILAHVFVSVLAQCPGFDVPRGIWMIFVFLLAAVFLPFLESVNYITRDFLMMTRVSELNGTVAALFQIFFATIFFRAKKTVVGVLSATKEAVGTKKKQEIERMETYIRYSAFFMVMYVVSTFLLATFFTLKFGRMVSLCFCGFLIAGTFNGLMQVIALPEHEK